MEEVVRSKSVKEKLEYIRVRLFMMASLSDFSDMVSENVHLYLEHDFAKEICKRMGISRRNIGKLESIAKARVRVIENSEDAEFYNEMADDIVKQIEIDINMLPENVKGYMLISSLYC